MPLNAHLSAFILTIRNGDDHREGKPSEVSKQCDCVSTVCMQKEQVNTYLAYEYTALSGQSCRRRWPLVSEREKKNRRNEKKTSAIVQPIQCNAITNTAEQQRGPACPKPRVKYNSP